MSPPGKGFSWETRAGIWSGSKHHSAGDLESLHFTGNVGTGVPSTTWDQNPFSSTMAGIAALRGRYLIILQLCRKEAIVAVVTYLKKSLEGDMLLSILNCTR